jgi:hypothetical protein
MKTLDQRILQNMQAELNLCKFKQSILRSKGLSSSIVMERIEFLERSIVAQKSKIEGEK